MNFNQDSLRQALAEGIGTFMLVLVGAGAVVLSAGSGTGALIPALAHGMILIAIIATYGAISGAHVNPAITLALWIGGRIDSQKAVLYWVAQILGAFAAAAVLLIILDEPGQLGATEPSGSANGLDIVLVEGLLTFFLAGVVYQAAVYQRGGPATPVLIGFTLAAAILLGGPITGASLNPARTLAPGFLADNPQPLGEMLIYLAAQFGGAALAALLHMDTFKLVTDEEAPKARRGRRS